MQVKQKQWKKNGSKSSYLLQLSKHKTRVLRVSGALRRYKTGNSDFKARFATLSDWDELTLQAMLTLMNKPNKKEELLYRKWIKTFPALTPNPVQAYPDFPKWMLYLKPWKSGSKVICKPWTKWTSYWVYSFWNSQARDTMRPPWDTRTASMHFDIHYTSLWAYTWDCNWQERESAPPLPPSLPRTSNLQMTEWTFFCC